MAIVATGIPPLAAIGMSLLVFAGASMVASAQLLAAGTPAALVVLTTLFINLRFMMYGASLRPHFARLPLGWRMLMGYVNADNVYGVCLLHFDKSRGLRWKLAFFFGSSAVIWTGWQLGVALGALAGAGLPTSWRLEFAAPLAFIAMSVPLMRDRAMVAAALAAGLVVIAAHELPFRLAVIAAAACGMACGLAVERLAPPAREPRAS